MTLSYLYRAGSIRISAGFGKIILAPDTGQYWLPTLIHVSTRTGLNAQCQVRTGSLAALQAFGNPALNVPDLTTIKDATYQGSNDTSTILSGTVISPGEGIRIDFSKSTTGEIGFVEVIGLSSDIPPTIGIVPRIPGARFAGAQNIGLISDVFLNKTSGTVINAGLSQIALSTDTSIYNSFYFCLDAVCNANPPTGFGSIEVTLFWAEQTGQQGTPVRHIFTDKYWIFGRTPVSGSAFDTANGCIEIQTPVHSGFLIVTILNNGPDAITTEVISYGSSRVLSKPYVRAEGTNQTVANNTTDSLLVFNRYGRAIGAGVTESNEMKISPGLCRFVFAPVTAGPQTLTFINAKGETVDGGVGLTVAAGTVVRDFVMLPNQACRAVVNNTGAGAGTYNLSVIRSADTG